VKTALRRCKLFAAYECSNPSPDKDSCTECLLKCCFNAINDLFMSNFRGDSLIKAANLLAAGFNWHRMYKTEELEMAFLKREKGDVV